jgi:hypothetical protein
MEEILVAHEPEPLTPAQDEDLKGILKRAREFYRERGELE